MSIIKHHGIEYIKIDDPKYKYKLVKNHTTSERTKITGYSYNSDYIELFPDGLLTVKQEYAWDGPSGPTFDTKNFMRGSLIHDAFYQLIREGGILYKERKEADKLLRRMCRKDGMWVGRAYVVYYAVRAFGFFSCKRKK